MSEELSIDEAVDMLNGVQVDATEPTKPIVEPVDPVEPIDPVDPDDSDHVEPIELDEPTEPPVVDFNAKVKFKANGQEVEKSIQDLINDAQLASNYNQKMQELAQQRKAFDAALQQPPQAEQPNPLKEFEDLNNEITARAMKMLGITDPEEFIPDAMGLIGNKVHYAAYQKALLDVQQEKQSADYAQQQERVIDESYYTTVSSFMSEPDFADVRKFAMDALYELPKKGEDGAREFQRMYNIQQKIQLREQHWEETQQYGRSNVRLVPFTANEVAELTKFYNSCKQQYREKQTKTQVKNQIPKSVPIKPTVKVESTGNGEAIPARKLDIKKIREMDIDDIAKML